MAELSGSSALLPLLGETSSIEAFQRMVTAAGLWSCFLSARSNPLSSWYKKSAANVREEPHSHHEATYQFAGGTKYHLLQHETLRMCLVATNHVW